MEEAVPNEGKPGSTANNSRTDKQLDNGQSDIITDSSISSKKTGILYRLKSLFWRKEQEGSLKEALQEVLDEHADELVSLPAEEREIFTNLLDFGEVEVSEIMIPQPDIVAVDINGSLQDLKDLLLKERHTRMPVYEESVDHVKGFIHVKDLVQFLGTSGDEFRVEDILREILFVPPVMKIADLLLKMRSEGVHIAIVVDEYGGTSGLVTLEDLFEEIVGEIQDEHDDEHSEISLCWDNDGQLTLDAKTKIEELEQALDIKLYSNSEDEDFDTIGGLIFTKMGKIPACGEIFQHSSGINIEILEADARRIKKVRLIKSNNNENGDSVVHNTDESTTVTNNIS